MDSAIKQTKVPQGSREESNDLSAGFVPKNTSAAGEPVSEELTTDSCIDGKKAEITFRWCTEHDLPALQRIHFEAEVASGRAMYLPDLTSKSAIAVAEKDGQIIGGIFGEDSVEVGLIGTDPEVLASAGESVIQRFIDLARREGTRSMHISLPPRLAATLDGAAQKAGFRFAEHEYVLETRAEELSGVKRNTQ